MINLSRLHVVFPVISWNEKKNKRNGKSEEEAFMETIDVDAGQTFAFNVDLAWNMFNRYLCDLRSTFARLDFAFVFASAEDVKRGSINDRKNTGTFLLCLINGNDISSLRNLKRNLYSELGLKRLFRNSLDIQGVL